MVVTCNQLHELNVTCNLYSIELLLTNFSALRIDITIITNFVELALSER